MSITPAPRIDMPSHAGGPYAAMVRVEERIQLDPVIRHLVKIRASLINGCAFCLDMHWTDARRDGESELRLSQLGGWEESPAFDDRERAALALTDAMTRMGDGTAVSDEVWEEATRHFDEDELANLMVAIAAINFWNRLAVTSRTTPASFLEAPQAA